MKKIFKTIIWLIVAVLIIGGSFFYFYYIWAPQHYDFNCEEKNCNFTYTGFSACAPCNYARSSFRCVPAHRLKIFNRIKDFFVPVALCKTCHPSPYLYRCDPNKTNKCVSNEQCVNESFNKGQYYKCVGGKCKVIFGLKEKFGSVLSTYYFLGGKIDKDYYANSEGRIAVFIEHSCSSDKLDDIKGVEIGTTAGNISTAVVLKGKRDKLLDVAAFNCVENIEIIEKMKIPSPPIPPKEPTE